VEHKTFGQGRVTSIKGDRVTIEFAEDVGAKTLLAGFAPMRKVDA
jgi:hypothetical protein